MNQRKTGANICVLVAALSIMAFGAPARADAGAVGDMGLGVGQCRAAFAG